MVRTWKPTAGGVLTLIAGIIGLITGIVVATAGEFLGAMAGILGFGVIGVPLIVIGIIAIIGGVFALRRRLWILALIGSICALLCSWILAILAIIFIAISRKEFS